MRFGWLALALWSGCAGSSSDEATDVSDGLVGDAAAGATLFTNNCSFCHGADGGGGSGPSLIDLVPTLEDADITGTITEGQGNMPAIDLDDQELADVLAYLRDTFGE